MRKLINKIFCFFVFVIFFTNITKAEYIDKSEVLKLDNNDHEKCINKVNMFNVDALELYWNCRISLINDYISEVKNNNSYSRDYRNGLQNIKKIILYRKEEALDKTYQERYNKRYVQTVFLDDNDWYYFDLINEKFTTEIIYIQELREKKNAKQKTEENKRKQKEKRESICYKYKHDIKLYNKCLESLRLTSTCLETLEESVLEKELEYKFNCKKAANEKYPDMLVLYNNEYERLSNIKKDKYIVDRSNDKKINDRKKQLNNAISGPKLSKAQILDLRNNEEKKCFTDKIKDLDLFRSILTEQCEKIKENIK